MVVAAVGFWFASAVVKLIDACEMWAVSLKILQMCCQLSSATPGIFLYHKSFPSPT